ncbi:MAG: alpha/beta hydrolase [Pseudomonadota bacterium]
MPSPSCADVSTTGGKDIRRRGYIDGPLGQVHYWVAGNGPSLVLLHQSGNSGDEFASLVPHLAGHYRMIVPDLPGHGLSADPIREPTVDDYTDAVDQVLSDVGVARFSVVGHHGGALAAMNLAARHPERIIKTVLSGTSAPRSDADTNAFIESILAVDTRLRRDPAFMADAWERYVGMASDGAQVEDIARPFIQFLQARLRPFRGVLVNLRWRGRAAALAKLRGPVLLLQGDRDRFVSDTEALTALITNSRYQRLAGCGTFMFYDRATDCATVIHEFLSE